MGTTHDFSGRVVFISGAAGGFGRAAALRFAEAGATLVVTDLTEKATHSLVEEVRARGAGVAGIHGDISQASHAEACVRLAADSFGRLDIAINNAGIVHPQQRLDDIPQAMFARLLETNVMGVFLAMKYQLPLMRRQFEATGKGGVILNTASVAGVLGAPMLSAYAATKHAVVGLTRSAALENGRKGIRINALCPSFARTSMVTDALENSPHGAQEAEARMVSGVAMRRIAEVDEIVQAILWACSDENSFYTGQTVVVDGGLSAG